MILLLCHEEEIDLIHKLNLEKMKNHVDEMSELIYIIISNSYKLIDIDNLNILVDKIKMVSNLNVKDYKSLTNTIYCISFIFYHL